jgi:hypothetical protein
LKIAASFSGWAAPHSAPDTNARLPLQMVNLFHNEFYGSVTIRDAQQVVLENNTFHEGAPELTGCREVIRK